MSEGEVVALGSINVDVQARVDRLPKAGELVLGRDFYFHGGGKGANVAFIGRKLGATTRLIGHVGDDVLRDIALQPLQSVGAGLHYTRTVSGQSTATALIAVQADGEKAIILASNANDAWTPEDAGDAAAGVREAGAGSVLVADLEVPVFVVRAALQAARACGYRVVVDPSPTSRMDGDLFGLIDFIAPDDVEAEQLTGIKVGSADDGFRAGDALRERGVGVALVKLGEGGCVLVSDDTRAYIPPFPVKVVDKTGAGDAFAGALGVALVEGMQPREAARFAVAAASFAVSGYGSQPSYPDREQLNRLLASRPAP